MTQWSPEADHVDLYNKYQKSSTDGFDIGDLGTGGMYIDEHDFADMV